MTTPAFHSLAFHLAKYIRHQVGYLSAAGVGHAHFQSDALPHMAIME
jgi:hypothetical protein